jgi:hypothetical protein
VLDPNEPLPERGIVATPGQRCNHKAGDRDARRHNGRRDKDREEE